MIYCNSFSSTLSALNAMNDSEVIIIEIVDEWLGHDRDWDICQYFRRLWLHFLANIPTHRTKLASQAANLWAVKQKITEIFNDEVSYGYCTVKEKMFLGFSGAFVNFNERHPGFTESDTRKC